jgi:Tfp pilus assembly protein PilV
MSFGVRRPPAGFSLVEAVIGLALLAMVCLALYSGLSSTTLSVRMARENLRATQIMTEKLETIRLYSWAQLTDPNYMRQTQIVPYYPQGQLPPELQRTHGNLDYSVTLHVDPAPVEEMYRDSLRLVSVEVTWKSGSMNRSRKMSTLVSRYGLHKYVY